MRIGHWLILLSSVLSLPASAGWYTGNAGDIYSAEFILTGRALVRSMRLMGAGSSVEIPNVDQLSGLIESVLVHSEETVFNNGHEVDAANLYPQSNEIILNRSRWRELRRPMETSRRFLLVLHEYLWMMGIEDLGFKKSMPIVAALNVKNYSPNVFWNPVNPVNLLEVRSSESQSCSFGDVRFDINLQTEIQEMIPSGNCAPEVWRRVKVSKFSNVTPPSSGVRGVFHRYNVEVFDGADHSLGSLIFEPEWGRCLIPDDEACRSTGKLFFNGVELSFGFLEKN